MNDKLLPNKEELADELMWDWRTKAKELETENARLKGENERLRHQLADLSGAEAALDVLDELMHGEDE